MEIGIILASVGAFFGGAVSIYALLAISAVIRKKRSERKKVNMRSRRSEASEAKKTAGKDKPRIGKMDLILVIMGVTLLLFTLKMIDPDAAVKKVLEAVTEKIEKMMRFF